MKLEELVPPFDLCKKIPAGEFKDSAFVYVLYKFAGDAPKMLPREHEVVKIFTDDFFIYPAPTLQEIMEVLPDNNSWTAWFCQYCSGEWSIGNCERDLHVKNGTEDSNPATAALKGWLKLKGKLKNEYG